MNRPQFPRDLRLFLLLPLTLGGGAAHGQVVPDGNLSLSGALFHDLNAASSLIARQMAVPFSHDYGLALLVVLLALALVLGWPLRLWLHARLGALLKEAPIERRLAVRAKAAGAVVLTTLLMATAGQLAWEAFSVTRPLLPESEILLRTLAIAVGVTGFGLGLGRALRSPDDRDWRPVALPHGLGRAIGFYPFAAGFMLGLTNLIEQASRVLHATNTSWTIAQGLIVLIETCLIARFLVLAGEAREREIESAASARKGPVLPAAFGVTALVWAALAFGFGAFLFGHTRLSMLVLQELLWTGLVLTFAWLLTGFVDALLGQLLDADWTVGRFATAVVGVGRSRVTQLALVGSALLTVVIWLLAIGLVAAPLHGDHAVVIEQIRPSSLVRTMQSLNLSPRTVVTALVVLIVGIALTRMVRRWLENRFLPATSLDIGVRTSIVTGMTYVGVLVALLVATNMLGLQLEKITLIASALSVGIGFGLQSIIQNFVSGVILLIERPVKPGDWIAVAGAEGTIRKIRVRATELVTADGGIAIVPNSSFISSNVANHADSLMAQRLDLPLTVTGCPTAPVARDLLLELAKDCPCVRDAPTPQVLLGTIGDGQWVFTLRVYAPPQATLAEVRSDLLFWLSERTEGKDIKIRSA